MLFDTTIDQTCTGTGSQNECFLTLHDNDGSGYNGWGTPLATLGYFKMNYDGQGIGQGTLPIAYAAPSPTTYTYPPAPTSTTTISSSMSSPSTLSTSVSVTTASGQDFTSVTTVTDSSTATTTQGLKSSTVIPVVSNSKSKSTSKGVIAGVAIGASLAFLLALLGLFLLFRRKKLPSQEHLELDDTKSSPVDKSASDVALVERFSAPPSPRSPPPVADKQAPIISPEALRDFITAASLDHRTILDPPVMLRFPGDELSALICNIWDAIAVRETYVSRLSPSTNIPTTLESLRKQAKEISKRIGVPNPVMLSVTSTRWKGDAVGWSEADRFKHTFAFSGATDGVIKKRLVVRRGESIGDGKKFETHETWTVGNCNECQSYLGATPIIKASMTIYVSDGTEVEACARCTLLAENFKKLHGIQIVDPGTEMAEKEQQRAELARQAVEREWERMEQEYRTREMTGIDGSGSGRKRTGAPSRLK